MQGVVGMDKSIGFDQTVAFEGEGVPIGGADQLLVMAKL